MENYATIKASPALAVCDGCDVFPILSFLSGLFNLIFVLNKFSLIFCSYDLPRLLSDLGSIFSVTSRFPIIL